MTGDVLVAYFGFGSLVNRHTLRTSFVDVVPARLKGWRRHWVPRENSTETDVPFLSIHEAAGSVIDGMIVIDQMENLSLVDEREAGYDRVLLRPDQIEVLREVELPEQVYVYIARSNGGDGLRGQLLQSYLDAVMQGFRNEFGDEGLQRFMETTDGFAREIIKDRDAPVYPRSVSLTAEDASQFDLLLKNSGVIYP